MTQQELQATTEDQIREQAFDCLVGDANGIYMGQRLLEDYGSIEGIPDEDRETILAGPDHEYYFDSCYDMEQYATIKCDDGKKRSIAYLDGGIFAVDYQLIQDWEAANDTDFDWN